MLHRKSIIAFWRYCSIETFQLLIINEINPSFWNGQSIFHLQILLKSFQNYQPFFLSFERATGLLRGNQWAWILPSFFCALRTKKYDRFIFFCLRVIFLCFYQNTYSSVPDAILECSLAMAIRQIDFFFIFISNGSQVWVMSTIKISLILVRLVQLFSVTFFI